MPQLPSLTDFQLRHCKVCVRLDHAVEFEKSLILRHKTRDEDELVRVSCHGGAGKNPSFLHVEMAVRDWFPVEKPKVAGRKQKFDKLIEALKGQECDANVAGTFRVKFEHLPESGIIRAAATPSAPHQGLTIRLRGATFDLKGMPFSSLQWSLVQPAAGLKEQMVNVTISGRTKVVVSDFYLQESVKFLTTWFNSIVMGK